jgi:hypothetical protein
MGDIVSKLSGPEPANWTIVDALLTGNDALTARVEELETALAALCQVCDGPLDNPAWPGVLEAAHAALVGKRA